jgi:glycosidase
LLADVRRGFSNSGFRPLIYQLMVRTFGNTNETRKPNGSIGENGCGTFADLSDTALGSLRDLGFNHVWLTGVLEHASGTAYPERSADPPELLKGIAGSPYAIKDYFDVCPDYALNPAHRLEEFRDLVGRCHRNGLRVLLDFVPNHVARCYRSDVKPEASFGAGDDPTRFFDPENHFFYLQAGHPRGGPPLRLPVDSKIYRDEDEYGRVTGNNAITWTPSIHDWYETVKLNYGHDFTKGRDTSRLPGPNAGISVVPKTWRTMDEVLSYWQGFGIDGFRADMAHMIPMEFWHWAIARCRQRDPDVFFCAEAYDNDPAKLTEGNVLDALLDAGFDAVYDDPSYDVLEGIYDSGKWANDLDAMTFTGPRFHRSLRYGENHDEVRLANPKEWGGTGMKVGKPVCATLFGMGRGPVLLYHGQEIGEPAIGSEGFCGDNARTSIFDYASMPEFTKWFNGGLCDGKWLSAEQKELRAWYGKLLTVLTQPAFTDGEFYGLNHANRHNPGFGRLDDETCSGHWLYAYLRREVRSGQAFLVIANFHGWQTMRQPAVLIPHDARMFLERSASKLWTFSDRLDGGWSTRVPYDLLEDPGLELPDLPPCTALMLEILDA